MENITFHNSKFFQIDYLCYDYYKVEYRNNKGCNIIHKSGIKVFDNNVKQIMHLYNDVYLHCNFKYEYYLISLSTLKILNNIAFEKMIYNNGSFFYLCFNSNIYYLDKNNLEILSLECHYEDIFCSKYIIVSNGKYCNLFDMSNMKLIFNEWLLYVSIYDFTNCLVITHKNKKKELFTILDGVILSDFFNHLYPMQKNSPLLYNKYFICEKNNKRNIYDIENRYYIFDNFKDFSDIPLNNLFILNSQVIYIRDISQITLFQDRKTKILKFKNIEH